MAARDSQSKSVKFPFENPDEWKRMEDVLKSKITTVRQLEESIETIAYGKPKGRLTAMSRFWSTNPSQYYKPHPEYLYQSKEHFLTNVVPFMQELALQLPTLFKGGLKLLLPRQNEQITLSQEQAACLIVSGFLGLFAPIDPVPKSIINFPHFDFTALQQGINPGALHCLLHYFIRIHESMPKNNIIIERKVLKEVPNWSKSDKKIRPVTVSAEGTIEDSPAELHADFANMYIGGGALEGGNVQEEILFVIKPECLITMLFCARMEDEEAIIIRGAERFSDYSGYGMSFAWKGDHRDKTPLDDRSNSLKREIIGIDAIMGSRGGGQFSPRVFGRDINKAYIGFANEGSRAIATGNWGCGAFGGDLHLKAFQQILAASQADCEAYYYTFKKEPLAILINAFQRTMVKNGITVGQLYNEYMNNHERAQTNVLEHMIAKFS